jgi:hypothetical protein
MKAAKMSMGERAPRARLSLTLLVAGLTAFSVGTAIAQVSPRNAVVRAQHAGSSPKVVSKAHQPVGTPHKVSSFAPHPTKQRVFGDPIQPPIFNNVPPPKKTVAPK